MHENKIIFRSTTEWEIKVQTFIPFWLVGERDWLVRSHSSPHSRFFVPSIGWIVMISISFSHHTATTITTTNKQHPTTTCCHYSQQSNIIDDWRFSFCIVRILLWWLLLNILDYHVDLYFYIISSGWNYLLLWKFRETIFSNDHNLLLS